MAKASGIQEKVRNVYDSLSELNAPLGEFKKAYEFLQLSYKIAGEVFTQEMTRKVTGMVMGTVDYLSPEQVTGGQLSTATDVYCLGATFYEMITGQPVYSGDTIGSVTQKIIENNPPEPKRLRNQLPGELNSLIMQMMQKEKENRPTMKDVFNMLQDICYRYRL